MLRYAGPFGCLLLLALGVYAGAPILFPAALPIAGGMGAAGAPSQVNHQGVVAVNGVRFTGTGDFRFAVIDPGTGTNVWTNDGSQLGQTGMPSAAVSLGVTDGVYSLRLGDTSLTNMVALPATTFADSNRRFRVWFDDGSSGVQQLSPDHVLATVPYAFVSQNVADGSLTAGSFASTVGVWDRSGNDISYSAGKVGVGTGTPGDYMHIRSSGGSDNVAYVTQNGDRQYRIGVRGDTNDVFAIQDDTAGAFRVAITSTGDVGVGTATPKSRLQVNGYLQIPFYGALPPAADCDDDSEIGRLAYVRTEDANFGLWVCFNGGGFQWKKL